MKPLKLTMNAFGSYADLQTIDFAALGANGLYLIAGETGSGKTTIFDAISFALFGRASGAGRENYAMLRSDFADGKDRTFVELDFVSGSAAYSIKRLIKKTGQEVALLLPDGSAVSGDRNVKAKVDEIVGLDREQFAQIVMIAQNDFLRFLQSGTDDRLKILRRIFGTEALKSFQDRLKTRAKQESDRRNLIIRDFDRHGVDVYRRGEQFAEWEAQIKSGRREIEKLDSDIAASDKAKQELAVKLAGAEDLGKKFFDLASLGALLAEHDSKAGEIEACRKRAAVGEMALRRVKPLADEAARAAASLASAQAGLAAAERQEAGALAELAQAKSAAQRLPPLAEAQAAFAALSKKWESAAEQLKKLSALQKNRDEIERRQIALAGKREELDGACKTLEGLPPADGAQAALDQLAQELAAVEGEREKLSALQADFAAIGEKQAALAKMQTEFAALDSAFADADGQHRLLEDAFFRSQAGILASALADGQPCPVCGSAVHPEPAALSDGGATEAELKKAKSAKDSAQGKREKKSLECGNARAQIETLSALFAAGLAALAIDAGAGDAEPGAAIAAAGSRLAEAASAAAAKTGELAGKKAAAEKSLAELKAKLDSATDKRNRLSPEVAALRGEIDMLAKRFADDFSEFAPNAEWEASKAELAQLLGGTQKEAGALGAEKSAAEKSLAELSASWETAAERKSGAESACKSAQTLAAERGANEQEASRVCAGAQAKRSEALRECGFRSEAEYAAALVTESDLANMSKRLTDYEKNGEQLGRDIRRLQGETAGKEPPDLERLKAEAQAASAEFLALGKKREEAKSRLDKAEAQIKELRQAAIDFEQADKSYAAAKQLSETANGKLNFETYAQMAYFERVLAAANHRLKAMSQSRYTLLRKTESSDARAKTGLEIEALDAYTGKARSANSLSGGESFMASLSLALGLSDVVQQSAGGIRLDAMFIDEGFGTLDTETLDIAIKTLSEMAGADRIIGIISHVAELRERIDKQIQVEKTAGGSRVTMLA